MKKSSVIVAVALVAAALVAPAGAAAQEAEGDSGVGATVGEGVAAAVDSGPALVVVALDVPGGAEGGGSAADIRAAQEEVTAALPAGSVERVFTFQHVPAMTLLVTDTSAIDALAAQPRVRRVDLDVGGTGSLDVTVPLTDADERHAAANDGDGVVVAVLDSGLDTDHPDLVNDVIGPAQACFGYDGNADAAGFCPNGLESQTGTGSAEDDAGHGTHVSGIISSDGVVASPGFAPGAELLPLKITDDCTFAGCFYSFTLNVVAALDHIIANPQHGVDVINMSVGTGTQFSGDCDNATAWTMAGATAINTLRTNGVIAFASAGNLGSTTAMSAPACLSNVVAVGASTDADGPASFTNVSTTTDIFAPGVNVVSDAIGGGTTSVSGTSMASPSAAGCAALLVEAGMTAPAAIETRLETSAVSVTAGNGLSYPRIDCGLDGNDLFASAATIGGPPDTQTGSNVGYTAEPGEPNPSCGDTITGSTNTAWWDWTSPGAGDVTIDTFGSNFDTVLTVYTGGAVNALTEVACNDDAGVGFQSSVTFAAAAGTTYRIQVDGFAGATGDITLNTSGCLDNDPFSCAATLPVRWEGTSTVTGSNVGYTAEPGEPNPSCGDAFGSTDTAWWNWTSPGNGSFTIDTNGSNFDTVLTVYTGGAVNALSEVACDDDGGVGFQSSVTFAAAAGTTYRIQVDGYAGVTGDITLSYVDNRPVLKWGADGKAEGDTGSKVLNIPITLSRPFSETVTIDYQAWPWSGVGFATAGVDYAAPASGTLTFLPGDTVKTVPVTIFGDTVPETPLWLGEWFFVRFSNPSPNARQDFSGVYGLGIGIIGEDDP